MQREPEPDLVTSRCNLHTWSLYGGYCLPTCHFFEDRKEGSRWRL